jgi:DDE_Tnp_1-associated/Transposase DDE domain
MSGFAESEPAMFKSAPSVAILDHFSALSDPRERWRVLYPLREILLLVLCATLSGMEDFVEIKLWGGQRLAFLRRFLPYERGIPAHDTLNDVINALDSELFKSCFANWVEALREEAPDIIAIDGKTSRRSHARSKGRGPLHLVSAWAARQRLVLGQEAVDEKSNEIIAIPLLLERLELTGALVTIDAMGTQSDIADIIVKRGGDYLLALKGNRPLRSCSFKTRRRTCLSRRTRQRTASMAALKSAAMSCATILTGCSRTAATRMNPASRILK